MGFTEDAERARPFTRRDQIANDVAERFLRGALERGTRACRKELMNMHLLVVALVHAERTRSGVAESDNAGEVGDASMSAAFTGRPEGGAAPAEGHPRAQINARAPRPTLEKPMVRRLQCARTMENSRFFASCLPKAIALQSRPLVPFSFTLLLATAWAGCGPDAAYKAACENTKNDTEIDLKMSVDDCAKQRESLEKKCTNAAAVHLCILRSQAGTDGKTEAACRSECKEK